MQVVREQYSHLVSGLSIGKHARLSRSGRADCRHELCKHVLACLDARQNDDVSDEPCQ